jgi:hypothetical protein
MVPSSTSLLCEIARAGLCSRQAVFPTEQTRVRIDVNLPTAHAYAAKRDIRVATVKIERFAKRACVSFESALEPKWQRFLKHPVFDLFALGHVGHAVYSENPTEKCLKRLYP